MSRCEQGLHILPAFTSAEKQTPVHVNDLSTSSVGETVLVTDMIWLGGGKKNLPQTHFE